MENIESGDGIEDDEIVQEQVGVHSKKAVATAVGADIDGDDSKEHSNIHIGEKQWGSDPTNQASTPEAGFSVEADFVEGIPEELNTDAWEQGIENNYALYGISLDLKRDDTISSSGSFFDVTSSVTSLLDMDKVNNSNEDFYLFATKSPNEFIPFSGAWGANFDAIIDSHEENVPHWAKGTVSIFGSNSHFIFLTNNDIGRASSEDVVQSPYNTKWELVAASTELHELAHSFRIGESDDEGSLPFGEVYTGSSDDSTAENLETRIGDQWGIMAAGWTGNKLFSHEGSSYYVFSIEVLTSLEHPDE
jgi:hypothetical protein